MKTEKLNNETKRVIKISFIAILFLMLSSFIFKTNESKPQNVDLLQKKQQVKPIPNGTNANLIQEDFKQEELIQLLKDLNVKYPHIVLAQSMLETGHYKSKIFKENNNLFGMKEAKVRIHTAKGTKNGHAYYDDWKESVYDYAFYQSTYYSDVKSERQYYRKLDRSYAEAKNYIESVEKIVERENLKDLFLDS